MQNSKTCSVILHFQLVLFKKVNLCCSLDSSPSGPTLLLILSGTKLVTIASSDDS